MNLLNIELEIRLNRNTKLVYLYTINKNLF